VKVVEHEEISSSISVNWLIIADTMACGATSERLGVQPQSRGIDTIDRPIQRAGDAMQEARWLVVLWIDQ